MDVSSIIESITNSINEMTSDQALLVGVSGIDASGKGYVTKKVGKRLTDRGIKVATINTDGWLNPPDIRFGHGDPGSRFYENALRLDEMFETLVIPLKRIRSIELEAELIEETESRYHSYYYSFFDVDVILLEGIFLFKHKYEAIFDLKIWIECSYETALRRAVARRQEGLIVSDTIQAYKKIYFPAQQIHSEIDEPISTAHIVFTND